MKTPPTPARFFGTRVRVTGLLVALGTLGTGATIAGFLAELAWFFELFSHFRVQYFLGLSVTAVLLLVPRRRRTAALFAVMALVNLATIVPLYWGERPEPATGDVTVHRVLMINVNRRRGDVARVRALIEKHRPDIVVLQEIDDRWIAEMQEALRDYPHSELHPREDAFGMGFYSRLPVRSSEAVYVSGYGVPSIRAEVETAAGLCTVLATHPVPPVSWQRAQQRNSQLETMARLAREATSPVILVGDFNTTPWSPYFRRLVEDSGLIDSTHGVHPTWPSNIPLLLIPIDHCLYSEGIQLIDRVVGPSVGSDHYPLIVDFAWRRASSGK